MCASAAKQCVSVLFFLTLIVVSASDSRAMPWDEDMFKQDSFQTNEMARIPATGSVPIGFQPFSLRIDQAEQTLKNPVALTTDSVWRGQRLFVANCNTCHGKKGDGGGPVGLLPEIKAPNFNDDRYRNATDGRMYAVIHSGLGNMPRYGYKFTPTEHWDLVNYIRFLQGQDVPGMKRLE
jgi:mono/diheme cytochrome c family protein